MNFVKASILTIALLLLNSCKEKAWINFSYDEASAYYYENYRVDSLPYDAPIIFNGKLNPTVYNKQGEKLNEKQIEYLDKALHGDYGLPEGSFADCYNPRHGVVFYLKGKPVAHVSICFDCKRLVATPDTKLKHTKILLRLFKEFKMPIMPEDFPR